MYEKTYKTQVLGKDAPPKKSPRRLWKKILVGVLVLAVLFFSGYLIKRPKLQVSAIVVTGTNVLDEKEIEAKVHTLLQGKVLWIFPRTSIFLVRERKLERLLQENFSRIETVSVDRTNFHTLSIAIKEFEPVYLWCRDDMEQCYFMDKNGIVYSEAPVFSGTAYPKIFSGRSLDTLPFVGMTTEEVAQVALLEKRLKEIGITTRSFHFVSKRELDIEFLHNKGSAHLLINQNVDTDTSLEYLFSALRTEPFASLFRNQNKKLSYIDVRFSNKVVYKFDE